MGWWNSPGGISLRPDIFGKGNGETDVRSFSGSTFNPAFSTNGFKPMLHVSQAVSFANRQFILARRSFESPPIVGDDNFQLLRLNAHLQNHTCRTRMFQNVVQRFFNREEKIVT